MTAYVGEIRLFAGNFAPAGWALCQGQILPISEYETLFQLIGTTYGGDGQETFALPDLRGRVPMHQGNGFTLAESAGVENVTLTINQIPSHTHPLLGTSAVASDGQPQGRVVAETGTAGAFFYLEDDPTVNLADSAIGTVGGNQPHDNCQPFLCINFIISLYGIFPSPT